MKPDEARVEPAIGTSVLMTHDKWLQVLELMQMHPKERLRRVILTGIWFNAINVGY